MTTETAQTEVETKTEEAPVDPRTAAIESIAARRREELVDEGVLPPIEAKEEEHEEEKETVPEASLLKTEEPSYTLKVNGQEKKVSQTELIALAQKGFSADEKFMTAAEIKRQAEELFRQSQEADAHAQKAQSSDGSRAKPPADMKELAEKLYLGDANEIAEALVTLKRQAASEAVQMQAEARRQEQEAVQQKQLEEGFVKFKETYPEIQLGTVTEAVADWHIQQLYREATERGQVPHMGEILMEAGKRTLAEMGLRKAEPKVDTAGRVEKKRAAGAAQAPTAGGRVTTKETESASVLPSEAVRSKAIQDMALARGQRIA